MGHAHKKLEQFINSVSSAFDVLLDDGTNKKVIRLDRSYLALHIVPGIWRELSNFSSCAICIVLALQKYKKTVYIRNYDRFRRYKNE